MSIRVILSTGQGRGAKFRVDTCCVIQENQREGLESDPHPPGGRGLSHSMLSFWLTSVESGVQSSTGPRQQWWYVNLRPFRDGAVATVRHSLFSLHFSMGFEPYVDAKSSFIHDYLLHVLLL